MQHTHARTRGLRQSGQGLLEVRVEAQLLQDQGLGGALNLCPDLLCHQILRIQQERLHLEGRRGRRRGAAAHCAAAAAGAELLVAGCTRAGGGGG